MPTRRFPTPLRPPVRPGDSHEKPSRGQRPSRGAGRGEVRERRAEDDSDVALQLAIGRDGIGLELAHPAHLGCLLIADLAATLPGLRFPVDVSGGVSKFRHRRGELHRLHVELPLRAFERWVAPRLRGIVSTRTPEVWLGTARGACTVCVGCIASDPEQANSDDRSPSGPPLAAFDVQVLTDDDALVFLVERPRGRHLPAPAIAIAIAILDATFGGTANRSGAAFVVRRAADWLTRALFPEAGARVPSSRDARWNSVGPHGDAWILTLAQGALAAAPSPEALRARETASLLAAADDAVVEGDLEEARSKYIAALERAPRHPEIVRRVADIDARAGGRAEAALALLAELDGQEAPIGTTRGELLIETGDVRGALASLERVGETDPAAPFAASAFELAARVSDDAEESARWLDRAVARAPRSTSARWLRVDRRLALGRLEDALADIEHLEALARGTRARHAVWLWAGRAWRRAGLGSRAATIYERALRYVPDEPLALAGLGVALLGEERNGRGVALLSRALDVAESRAEATSAILLDLARAMAEKLDDLPAAIARVATIPPDAPEALVARGLEGRWRAKLGDLAGAALAFARLRELSGSLPAGGDDARAGAAVAFLSEGAELERARMGDLLAAQRHLGAALRIRPQDSALRRAYRDVGMGIARPNRRPFDADHADPDPDTREDEALRAGPAVALPRIVEDDAPGDDDALRAARVEELTRRLHASPQDDVAAEELTALLESLGRGHELLALLSARLEDATPEQRARLAPRARAALERLARDADAAGRAEEAALYRGAIEALPS